MLGRVRAWWGRLPPGARWGLAVGAVLLAVALLAKVWGAAVLALGALAGTLGGRTPASATAAEAARRARTAAELQAASARVLAEVHRTEHDAARARDRARDRAMAEAAERAALPPAEGAGQVGGGRALLDPPQGDAEGEPAFLRAVRERGGRP